MSAASRRVLALLCALSLLPVLAATPVAAAGATLYVTTSADGVPLGDGDCTLREAIIAANTNTGAYGCDAGSATGTDTILFLPNTPMTITIDSVAKNLPAITGSTVIDGKEIVTVDVDGQTDTGPLLTVLSGGNLTVRDMTFTKGSTGFLEVDSGGTLTIAGCSFTANQDGPAVYNFEGTLSVSGGQFSDNQTTGDGAAIKSASAQPLVISGGMFSSNQAGGNGGAIFSDGPFEIRGAIFDGNSSLVGGGAVFADGLLPSTISGATFTGNGSAGTGGSIETRVPLTVANSTVNTSTASGNGGAIRIGPGGYGTKIVGSTFANTSAFASGGAIQVDANTSLEVTDSAFSATTSTGSDGGAIWGGALAPVTVTRTTFTSGSATNGGAISASWLVTSNGSTFDSNSATDKGGAIYVSTTGSTAIRASTFTGNTAADGGAYLADGAEGYIVNSTFKSNTATGFGGAISTINEGVLTLAHLTVTGNSAATGGGIDSGDDVTLTNAIVANNSATTLGSENIQAADVGPGSVGNVIGAVVGLEDFLADALANNGGPTQTLRLFKVANNPFRDTANSTACAASIVGGKDQRGGTRPASGCDIGAFELDTTAPVISVAPKPAVRAGVAMDGTKFRARVSWSVTDGTPASGIKRFVIEQSVNGGAYTMLADTITTRYYDVSLSSGKTYRFRVRATDNDNNTSATVAGPTVSTTLKQQTSSSVAYRGTWGSSSSTAFSGGSVKRSSTKGASATFTFTGRSVAWVTTTAKNRGKAKLYLDGTYIKTVDLYALTTAYRVQVYAKTFSKSGTHTLRIVVLGTSGRPRVDVDAFAVIK